MAGTGDQRSAARCGQRPAGRVTGCPSPACTRPGAAHTPADRSPVLRAATPPRYCLATSATIRPRSCRARASRPRPEGRPVADAQVNSAIANWGPRFTAQGVDPGDFSRVTAGIESWKEWLGAWRDNGDLHAGLARDAAERGRLRTAGEAWIRAAVSYHFGKFVWMLDMDAHDAVAGQAVEAMYRGLDLLDPSAERIEIPFGGVAMVGNLRKPPGVDRPPLVLLIAGLDSTKEEFFAVENTFLARGLATFSLDGPGQGESARAVKIRPDFEAPVAAKEEAYQVAERMSLAGVAERIAQPMVVVVGKRDRLVPWQHAERVAAEAPAVQLWMFDEGNHVCANLTYRWRPQAADWLADQLAMS